MTAKPPRPTAAQLRQSADQPTHASSPKLVLRDEGALVSAQSELPIPLTSRAVFWQPRHSGGAGSLLHLPFLFWLMEISRPVRIVQIGIAEPTRFLSLCQAVDKLGLEALCMGVASDGQGLSGSQAEQHSILYGDFSFVTTEDVVRATRHIHGQGVDLLVIDAPLGDDLVVALRTHWAPFLSDRAVIVVHDPEANLAGAEARQYFDGLAQDRPSIFFTQATPGLQVILLGAAQPERLLRLADLELGMPGYLLARQVFSRLGQGLESTQAARRAQETVKKEKNAAKALEQKLADTEAALAAEAKERSAAQAAEQELVTLVADLQATVFDLESKLREVSEVAEPEAVEASETETLRGQLEEAQALVQAQAEQLAAEKEVRSANAQKRERLEKAVKLLEEEKAALAKDIRRHQAVVGDNETLKAEIAALKKENAELAGKVNSLSAAAEDHESRWKIAYRKRDEVVRTAEALEQEKAALVEEVRQLQEAVGDSEALKTEIAALKKENTELADKVNSFSAAAAELESRRKTAYHKRDELMRTVEALEQEKAALAEEVRQHQEAVGDGEALKAKILVLEKDKAELADKVKSLSAAAEELESRRKAATRKRDELTHTVETLQQEKTELMSRTKAQVAMIEVLETEKAGLKEVADTLEKQVRHSQAKRLAIWGELEAVKSAYGALKNANAAQSGARYPEAQS